MQKYLNETIKRYLYRPLLVLISLKFWMIYRALFSARLPVKFKKGSMYNSGIIKGKLRRTKRISEWFEHWPRKWEKCRFDSSRPSWKGMAISIHKEKGKVRQQGRRDKPCPKKWGITKTSLPTTWGRLSPRHQDQWNLIGSPYINRMWRCVCISTQSHYIFLPPGSLY